MITKFVRRLSRINRPILFRTLGSRSGSIIRVVCFRMFKTSTQALPLSEALRNKGSLFV